MNVIPEAYHEIRRLIGELDASLDGIPAEEIAQETSIKSRAKQLDAEIVRLLKKAGHTRETVGTDPMSSLRHEELAYKSKRAGSEEEASIAATNADSIRREIEHLNAEIKKDHQREMALKNQIDFLTKKIRNRYLVQDIWYWIFDDKEKEEKTRIEKNLTDIQAELNQLHGKNQDKKARLSALISKETDLRRKANEMTALIGENTNRQNALRCAVEKAKEHEKVLADLKRMRDRQEARAVKRAQEGNAAAKALKEQIEQILAVQPRLAKLGPNEYGRAKAFPDAFSFGRYRFSAGNGTAWSVPRILPFPVPKALVFPATESGTAAIREFLLRSFQCLPPDSLEITVCDPVRMGASLNGFQKLLDNQKPFAGGKFPTVASEIETALSRLHGAIETFLQMECTGKIHDWASYNAEHPDCPKTFRILAMFDLPDQLTDVAASYLAKILENGPTCGILPLLALDPSKLDPRRHAALKTALRSFAWKADRLESLLGGFPKLRNVHIDAEDPCAIPDEADVAAVLAGLCADYKERDRFAGSLESVWKNEPLWGASSENELEATIGWSEESRSPVRFSLGDQPVHALLGGTSGSGKTNLLHVLIHSLCHRYAPSELNLYLLDYKEATEFNAYAHPLLPHAAGIATESDVEYGISVLRHLEKERIRRSNLFKETGTVDIRGYRQKSGKALPRILLVIDEFQRLFEGVKAGAEAETLFRSLLKLGRAAGIHLLMATQTLNGLQNIVSIRTFLGQMACRLALKCTPEDSATLLATDNQAAAELPGPPNCILNNDLGKKSANIRLCIPLADPDRCKAHLKALSTEAAKRNETVANCRVFRGTTLPEPPPAGACSEPENNAKALRFAVGRTADFEETPVFADLYGKNLLVIARRSDIAGGLRRSIARGIAAAAGTKNIILFSENPEDWRELDRAGDVVRVDDECICENLEKVKTVSAERKVIVLDGFERLRSLHSSGFVSSRSGSPAEQLRSLVECPKKSGLQLVLFFRDYSRAYQIAKELLSLCDLRIGDMTISDPSKFLGFEGIGPRDVPVLSPTKAILLDRDADGPIVFRPFA